MKSISKIFLGLALAACLGFAGCGGTETETPSTTPATGAGDAGGGDEGSGDNDGAMNAPAGAEMVAVSLKLPNMTWGGCVVQVREALTNVDEFSEIELSRDGDVPTGTFMAQKGFDVEAKLDELAKTADKLKDWSRTD